MIKKVVAKGVSVKQFADEIGVTPERLLSQFKDADVNIAEITDLVSEEEKQRLLRYLQQHHGAKQEPGSEKIVLRRAKTSEIKVGGSHGAGNKTVSIQVRKKRTYVKRALPEEGKLKEEATALSPLKAQDEMTEVMQQTPLTPAASPIQEMQIDELVEVVPSKTAEDVTKTSVSPPSSPETAEEKEKNKAAALKRKDKHRSEEMEEADNERHKKKKKTRETQNEEEKNFEALLARGADLSRVFKHTNEEAGDIFLKKSGKLRAHITSKVKVQAFTKPTMPIIREVEIPETIHLAELAQKMSVKVAEVIKVLMKMGVIATINQVIDQDTAILVVEEMGHKAKSVSKDALEKDFLQSLEVRGEAVSRPPVITIMGHVDHGKTTLLDYIRTTKVAASEAGGITQHIGAYHVKTPKGTITFLDTPGHAAFTAMRARGAQCTDIVILVVAADDGMMPQTEEAIQHARSAGVPIVVAVTKVDKPAADPERVKSELSAKDVIAEDWGGDVQFVNVSAHTGTGIDNLLDAILLQAEVLELKAPKNVPGKGVVIESSLDRGRGAVSTVLVQKGTLRRGDIVVAGTFSGRVRAMLDEAGGQVIEAGPSIPVEILGLDGTPDAGDEFVVVADERKARELTEFRTDKNRKERMQRQHTLKLETMFDGMGKAEVRTLNIVLKTDVRGSLEALTAALNDIGNEEVQVRIISSGVGGITETDANLALASSAVLIGFNVRADASARRIIEESGLDLRYYSVIYEIIDHVRAALTGMLAPAYREDIVGIAEVRDTFKSPKFGQVAGCLVVEGTIYRNKKIRVLRNDVVIFEGELESLRRFKDDVNEVRAGTECGIGVKNYDVKVGDKIEVFDRISVERTLN